MTTVKALYSASGAGTSITWTSANTLASGGVAGCLAIDNTTNLYVDAMVMIQVGVGVVAAPKSIDIWGSLSEDGSTYLGNPSGTDNYTGTDAALTALGAPPVFYGPFTHPTNTASITTKIVIPSVRDLFGGLVLPKKWGLIIVNNSGVAFTSLSAEYTGVQLSNV